MDFVSHALVGLTIYQARKPRFSCRNSPLLWVAIISSEMPDFDIVYRIGGNMAYLLNHRGITHSLPGVILMAAALAYIIRHRYPMALFRSLFGWSMAIGIIHILLDALNTWGTRIWFPFSNTWITWDVLPFIDPPLIIICGGSILAGILRSQNSRRFALAAISLFSVYVGGRYILHQHFLHALQMQYASTAVQKICVLPTIHPLRWQAVIETKSSIVLGNINTTTLQVDGTAWYPIFEDPRLTGYRTDGFIAQSLPFFRYPALTLQQEAGKNVVVISDLYFGSNTQRRAAFELHSDGSIKRPRRTKLPMIQ
jgi:inner membrane protein